MKKVIFITLVIVIAMIPHKAFLLVPSASMDDYTAFPAFVTEATPPLVMITMSKDQKLFFKAYNDVVDLNGDGNIEPSYDDSVGYNADTGAGGYYGYFDPNKCYAYSSSDKRFNPSSAATGAHNHYCGGVWSGNFLNWASMARIDILRKVLYGGKRIAENNGNTVLGRTKLPRDAHSWAKAYNGSDISSLTPYSWSGITLCNTDKVGNDPTGSLIMVKQGYYPYAASLNAKQCTKTANDGGAINLLASGLYYELYANVAVCVTGQLESNCLAYVQGASATNYRPSGIMEKYGVNRHGTLDTSDDTPQMYFGLITGTYEGNKSGGVLRSNISDMNSEVDNATGNIKGSSRIISTIDKFEVIKYDYTTGKYIDCGLGASFIEGNCESWGNPMGEMYYEALRYFMGKGGPTTEYNKADTVLSIPNLSNAWCDPYNASGSCTVFAQCSKPFILILSDIYPSFDSDQLPGSYWPSAISTADTPSVQQLITDSHINTLESIGSVFVGQSGATNDGKCSSKAGSFGSIRGLCIEEPQKQGSYYIAGLTRWAHIVGFKNPPSDTSYRKVNTFVVADPSGLPNLEYVVNGQKVQMVPIFLGTNNNSRGQLVDFRICQNDADWTTEQGNGYQYCYDIMWDDSSAGFDYDLDIRYRIYVKTDNGAGTVTVKTKGVFADAGAIDTAGFIITGVENSGEYLEVGCGGGTKDCNRYCNNNVGYGACPAGYAYNMPLDTANPNNIDMSNSEIVRTFNVTGSGSEFLKNPLWYAAKYGGFTDQNGNNDPDLQDEWDANNDGLPDTYFYASNPILLESELEKAFATILYKAASGTSVSVLATTGEGEGAIYQAYFYPRKLEGTEDRTWLGFLHSLFLDPYGNLREDTNSNRILNLKEDYIVKTKYDQYNGTMVERYVDADGDGIPDSTTPKDVIPLDNVNSIWDAGKLLWDKNYADRTIYTTKDGYSFTGGGLAPDATGSTFYAANATALRTYLRANSDSEAANIINYIRGLDITGYRKRTTTINGSTKVWKLGDIVYSTPTAITKPSENYDLIYSDESYYEFRLKYFHRRQVVYVGANDGMLHAFNGGFYDTSTHKFWRNYSGETETETETYSDSGPQLGDELWGFIPREALPHLKWLTAPNYTHVYYVDLKPKVTDAKIFSCDGTHVGVLGDTTCWGTILIGGMRYGGKTIPTEAGNFRSTYFALDITDPEQPPRLLWTFDTTDAGATDLGLTLSYPAVAKVNQEWYAIFGSGPTNFDSLSNLTGFQKGQVFVLKISGGANGGITSWTVNSNYWKISTTTAGTQAFMANPVTIDVDQDYNVDVAYIGENSLQGSNRNAVMWRLNTMNTFTVSSWALSALYNVNSADDLSKRITSSPAVTMDKKGNLWVFFGTGQFLGTGDRNTTDTGAFYGIKDGCWNGNKSGCPITYTTASDLVDVSNVKICYGGDATCGGTSTSFSSLLTTIDSKAGWAIFFKNMTLETTDFLGNALLHQGERITTKPALLGGLLIFASYVPGTDVCTIEGSSNQYELYYETGSAYKKYVFKAEKTLKGETTDQSISRTALLGKGLPASTGLAVTREGKLKGFVQSSTGDIQPIMEVDPKAPTSGYTGWKRGGVGGL